MMFVLAFLTWLGLGSFTIALRERWLDPVGGFYSEKTDRALGHLLYGGLLWPIYLPLFFMWGLGTGKIKPVSLPKIGKSKAEKKVLEYADAPLLVLAQIVAQRILANPERLDYDTWLSEDKKIKVEFRNAHCEVLDYVQVSDKRWKRNEIGEKGVKLLEDAGKVTLEFNKRKIAQEKQTAAKLAALEAVESLLLTPEKDSVAAPQPK